MKGSAGMDAAGIPCVQDSTNAPQVGIGAGGTHPVRDIGIGGVGWRGSAFAAGFKEGRSGALQRLHAGMQAAWVGGVAL